MGERMDSTRYNIEVIFLYLSQELICFGGSVTKAPRVGSCEWICNLFFVLLLRVITVILKSPKPLFLLIHLNSLTAKHGFNQNYETCGFTFLELSSVPLTRVFWTNVICICTWVSVTSCVEVIVWCYNCSTCVFSSFKSKVLLWQILLTWLLFCYAGYWAGIRSSGKCEIYSGKEAYRY